MATSQGMLRLPANHQQPGKGHGKVSSSYPQKEPTLPILWSSRFQNCEIIDFCCLLFVVLCYRSPSKLMYSPSKFNGIFSILIYINFLIQVIIVASNSYWTSPPPLNSLYILFLFVLNHPFPHYFSYWATCLISPTKTVSSWGKGGVGTIIHLRICHII